MKTPFAWLRILVMGVALLGAAPAMAAPIDTISDTLSGFYDAGNHKTYFTQDHAFTPLARALPALIAGASAHGLDPQRYGLARMQQVLDSEPPQGDRAWKEAEVFFAYALWSYACDLSGHTLPAASLQIILDSYNPVATVQAMAPNSKLYKDLQAKLAELDGKPKDEAPHAVFDFGKRLFTVGKTHKDVPLLRQKLAEYGANKDDTSTTYDENLQVAVKRFQSQFGLTQDGKIGGITLTLLNRTDDDLRQQVVADMQQLRLPQYRNRPARRIEVSIPRFELTAFDNDQAVLQMAVVVGKLQRQTIDFATNITGVRFNPTWTVPDTIKQEDMLTTLQTDPQKLVNMGVQIYTGYGRDALQIDPLTEDWSKVNRSDMRRLRLWRPAGEENPLGQYRMLMNNPYDIYLHDTNHRDLFVKQYRALSSGCVRIQNPQALTQYLIMGTPNWNMERVQKVVARGQTYDLSLSQTTPVYIDYVTSFSDDYGNLVLGVDIYARASHILRAMKTEGDTRQALVGALLARAADILTATGDSVPAQEISFNP